MKREKIKSIPIKSVTEVSKVADILFLLIAVDVVCSRPHRIFEQDLDVKIYYECLGQVESGGEPFKPLVPLEISNIDPKKIQFLIKSPPNKQAVEKQLEAVYGKPILPKETRANSLTVECNLTPKTLYFCILFTHIKDLVHCGL